jgi:hypothetical protein
MDKVQKPSNSKFARFYSYTKYDRGAVLFGTTYISKLFYLFFYYWWGGTKSLGTAGTSGLLYNPRMIDEDDYGAIGGMKINYFIT